jgi:ketosteroid isomerase-like protein
MKIRLLFALVGLAISFAVPTIAQQTNTPDPQLRERLITRIKAHTDALDKNDAAAVAANFTEDAVNVEQDGPTFGREAIEKLWADRFQKVHFSNNLVTVDEDSPHIIGTDGKQMWATGGWSATIQGQNFGPTQIKGYWSVIREGDDWKIRMLTSNVTPAPAATTAATQETNTVDPEVRQQIEAVHMKFVEAQNKGDAAAIAALFTQDAVQMWYGLSEGGLASGQQAIEKRYRATFAAPAPLDSKIIQMFPVGSDICAISEYKVPTWKGHVVTIFGRDADSWKIRMAYSN